MSFTVTGPTGSSLWRARVVGKVLPSLIKEVGCCLAGRVVYTEEARVWAMRPLNHVEPEFSTKLQIRAVLCVAQAYTSLIPVTTE